MQLLENIFAHPYLFDEGPAVSSFALLFEGLPGAGAALFGVAPGVAWRAERLPCGVRDSATGETVQGSSFERGFSQRLTWEAGRRPG